MARLKLLVVSNRLIENASYFKNPEELERGLRDHLDPEAILFAFWSWKVPDWMLQRYKCYGLHTGPLLDGKGKGGSPIDNLKALGVEITTLCAFDMNSEFDGGKIRLAMPLYINVSKDHVIYRISQMLPVIVEYLTAKQPEIPEHFKRLPNVK
jgi:methionyl-tRNA formyltransferase